MISPDDRSYRTFCRMNIYIAIQTIEIAIAFQIRPDIIIGVYVHSRKTLVLNRNSYFLPTNKRVFVENVTLVCIVLTGIVLYKNKKDLKGFELNCKLVGPVFSYLFGFMYVEKSYMHMWFGMTDSLK